jgi:Sec-independent protein secretion pathway component TatC
VASQIVMSLPLCVLYFLSIGLSYAFGRRPSQEELAGARADRIAKRDAKRAAQKAKRAV